MQIAWIKTDQVLLEREDMKIENPGEVRVLIGRAKAKLCNVNP